MSGPAAPARPSPAGRRLRAGLLLMVLVEVLLAIEVGRWLGAPATVLLVVAFSALGVLVLRRLGRRALGRLDPGRLDPGRTAVAAAAGPGLAETATVAVGGLLLVLPGLLTGVVGLLLVLPPTRRLLRPALGRLTAPMTLRLLRAAGVSRIVAGEVVQVDVLDVRDVPANQPPPEPGGPGRALPPGGGEQGGHGD